VVTVPDGLRAAAAAAEFLEQHPSNPWGSLARHTAIVARHLLGELDDPSEELESIIAESADSPTLAVLASSYRLTALLRLGHEGPAGRCAAATAAMMHAAQLDRYPMVAPAHGALAMAAASRGDRAEVERLAALATDALRASSASPLRRAVTQLRLADAWLRSGDRAGASSHLASARTALGDVDGAVNLERWADELSARLERTSLQGSGMGVALTVAERRVLEELPTHRSLEEIGERLYVSRNTVKSHTIAIYRKLGVTSRSAAVAEAQLLGLLPTTA
jgi:LuxR family maltose regulon positive regulatory protein